MKKIAVFLTGAFLSISTIGAMANTFTNTIMENILYDGKKTKVERNELPQEIIQSLEEGHYQNWEIQEAFRIEDDQTNEVQYELHVASTSDAQLVRNLTFNESGEIISEKESDLGRSGEQEINEQGIEPGSQESEAPGQQY